MVAVKSTFRMSFMYYMHILYLSAKTSGQPGLIYNFLWSPISYYSMEPACRSTEALTLTLLSLADPPTQFGLYLPYGPI